MPITIKTNAMKYKKSDGTYEGFNAIAQESTAQQIASIQSAGTAQVDSVEQKGAEVLASIPSDYTELTSEVGSLKSAFVASEGKDETFVAVSSFDQFTVPKYWTIDGTETDGGTTWATTSLIPCLHFRVMHFDVHRWNSGANAISSIAFFDKNRAFISGVWANYMADGTGEFIGQCAIPDNAYYFCALRNMNNSSYTPNVTLYKDSVEVDLTSILTSSSTVYKQNGTTGSYSGWYITLRIPVEGFKSMSFVAGSYHSGSTMLESVTFFGSSNTRIDGVFTALPPNTTRNGRGTVPIPANAKWVRLLYNSANTEKPKLILHNYKDKPINILCIGDSITEGLMASMEYTTNNYPKNMQENLGLGYTVFNAGVGGSQAVTWWSTYKALLNLTNVDVIIIMLGINGAINNVFDTQVDPYDDYNNYGDGATGRTCSLIEWLQDQKPKAEIVLAQTTYVDPTIDQTHATQADRQNQYMYELVNRYNLPVINVRTLMGIGPKNCEDWLASDGVHGTEIFYEKLGMLFANQIKPIINIPVS